MSKQVEVTVFIIAAALIGSAAASSPTAMPEMRMTPSELNVVPQDENQIGSSKLAGVHTKVLVGDPSKPGLYSILLFVPPKTSIAAHSHRDDRMATVVSGTWHFGYGQHFDAKALKDLPPGSVYAEPGTGHYHFAQTRDEAVVVSITGFGPTDTHYFDPNDDPSTRQK
jgi:uncharacterized RmlC-like cupin family protein